MGGADDAPRARPRIRANRPESGRSRTAHRSLFPSARSWTLRMIRKATRADYPRMSEIRLAVHENRLGNPGRIAPVVDWLFEHSTFWVWDEDGAIQGFS